MTYGKKTEGDGANELADADGAGHVAVRSWSLASGLVFDEDNKSEMVWVEDSRQQCKEVRWSSFSVTSGSAYTPANQRAAFLHRMRGISVLFMIN